MMKKHIYNKVYGAALLATLLLAAAACTNEMPLADNGQDPDNANPEAGTLTTVTVSQDAGAQTRLEYTDNATTMKVDWKPGDVIYIGKKPAKRGTAATVTLADAGFKEFVCETANGKLATFKVKQGQELTGITPGTQLFAFYTNESNTRIGHYKSSSTERIYCNCYFGEVEGEIPTSFDAQRQLSNGEPTHVANHDFMYTYVTVSQQDEIPHLSFKRASSLLKFTLELPADAANKKMKKLEFLQNSLLYRTYFNFDNPTSFGSQNRKGKITLHLGGEGSDGIECDVSGTPTLTAYLVYGNSMPAGEEITLRVTDNAGNTYSTKITSNLIRANHFYRGTYTLKPDVSQ